MMFDFRPTETPDGMSVTTTFTLQDKAYAIDCNGTLYRILTHDPDPEYWVWTEVIHIY